MKWYLALQVCELVAITSCVIVLPGRSLSSYLFLFKLLELLCNFAELKDGRIPDGINKRMGYWKAEEFQKFTFPASEYVLGGILPDQEYRVWLLRNCQDKRWYSVVEEMD